MWQRIGNTKYFRPLSKLLVHACYDVTCVRYLPQEPAEVPRTEALEDPLRRHGPPRPPGVAAPDVHRPQDCPDRGPRQEVDQVLHPMDDDVVDIKDPSCDGVRVDTCEDDLLLGGHNIVAVR